MQKKHTHGHIQGTYTRRGYIYGGDIYTKGIYIYTEGT